MGVESKVHGRRSAEDTPLLIRWLGGDDSVQVPWEKRLDESKQEAQNPLSELIETSRLSLATQIVLLEMERLFNLLKLLPTNIFTEIRNHLNAILVETEIPIAKGTRPKIRHSLQRKGSAKLKKKGS